jgi:hypothetical protein
VETNEFKGGLEDVEMKLERIYKESDKALFSEDEHVEIKYLEKHKRNILK